MNFERPLSEEGQEKMKDSPAVENLKKVITDKNEKNEYSYTEQDIEGMFLDLVQGGENVAPILEKIKAERPEMISRLAEILEKNKEK